MYLHTNFPGKIKPDSCTQIVLN